MGRKPSIAEKPISEKILESELLEKQHERRLPWSFQPAGKDKRSSKKEAQKYLSEFMLGFLLGHSNDPSE